MYFTWLHFHLKHQNHLTHSITISLSIICIPALGITADTQGLSGVDLLKAKCCELCKCSCTLQMEEGREREAPRRKAVWLASKMCSNWLFHPMGWQMVTGLWHLAHQRPLLSNYRSRRPGEEWRVTTWSSTGSLSELPPVPDLHIWHPHEWNLLLFFNLFL